MTAYESDPATEPVQITTMRRIRKQHKLGQIDPDGGESLLDDFYFDVSRPINGKPLTASNTPRNP